MSSGSRCLAALRYAAHPEAVWLLAVFGLRFWFLLLELGLSLAALIRCRWSCR